VCSIGEQLPDVRNHVKLDPIVKDNLDVPVPHLVNRTHANDQAMIKAISVRLKELLEAAGAIEIWGNEHIPGHSAHYLGTCRMGTNPATSVVDPWCRTHDVSTSSSATQRVRYLWSRQSRANNFGIGHADSGGHCGGLPRGTTVSRLGRYATCWPS